MHQETPLGLRAKVVEILGDHMEIDSMHYMQFVRIGRHYMRERCRDRAIPLFLFATLRNPCSPMAKHFLRCATRFKVETKSPA